MTNIIRRPDQPVAANAPGPAAPELLERDIEVFLPLRTRLLREVYVNTNCRAYSIPDAGRSIRDAQRWLDENEIEDLRSRIAKATRAATREEIVQHVGMLVACYPSNRDPLYGRMLCEDIGAAEPSIGALEAACRHLRRTLKFAPAISEVLEELKKAAERLSAANVLDRFTEELREAKAELKRIIEKHRESRRQSLISDCMYKLAHGEALEYWEHSSDGTPVPLYSQDIVDEAMRRLARQTFLQSLTEMSVEQLEGLLEQGDPEQLGATRIELRRRRNEAALIGDTARKSSLGRGAPHERVPRAQTPRRAER
jgi:hypothetical protein